MKKYAVKFNNFAFSALCKAALKKGIILNICDGSEKENSKGKFTSYKIFVYRVGVIVATNPNPPLLEVVCVCQVRTVILTHAMFILP